MKRQKIMPLSAIIDDSQSHVDNVTIKNLYTISNENNETMDDQIEEISLTDAVSMLKYLKETITPVQSSEDESSVVNGSSNNVTKDETLSTISLKSEIVNSVSNNTDDENTKVLLDSSRSTPIEVTTVIATTTSVPLGTKTVAVCNSMYEYSKKRKLASRSTIEMPRNHPCTYEGCSYAAISVSHLNIHIRSHTKEKAYPCDYPECTYAATTNGNLKKHLMTHTGETPHHCPYDGCTYSATQSSDLKLHIRTHTGEKPHKCDFDECAYSASTASNLKKHKKIHCRD